MSWGVWIATFYDIIVSQHNIMSWCNVMSWHHIHGDRCLQIPVISDYQFNLEMGLTQTSQVTERYSIVGSWL